MSMSQSMTTNQQMATNQPITMSQPMPTQTVISQSKLNYLERAFIEYLSRLTQEEANTKAFEYITYTNYKWKGNSKLFNKKTVVRCMTHIEYYNSETNQDSLGLAHFTAEGQFYGLAKNLGIEPIYYHGEFVISPDLFVLDFDQLKYSTLQFKVK
jgi:hypothetical protein